MPHGDHTTLVMERARHSDQRPAGGMPISGRDHEDVISLEIERIIALADAGLSLEGREACAELMFDYQPQLAVRPELRQRFILALRRCNAEQLLRRLSIAMRGEPA
jgi:hypothetical protein